MILRDTDIESAVATRARQRALIEGRGPRVSEFLMNPYRFGAAPLPPDPNFSSRALGLHCNGSNGGTTFTDNSPTPKTVTATLCTTSTGQAKFGTTSALFAPGVSGGKLMVPHSSDLAPTGDFTFACWLYLAAAAAQRMIVYKSISSGHTPYGMRLTSTNDFIQLFVSNTAGSALAINATGTTSVPKGVWTHIALTRSGSSYRVFINGNVELTQTYAGAGYVNASHNFYLGNVSDDLYPLGNGGGNNYMDDVLFYNGIALWTAAFTPPTTTFADS